MDSITRKKNIKWRIYLQNICFIKSDMWRIVCAMIPNYCHSTGDNTHFNIWGFRKLQDAQLFARSFNELTKKNNCCAARIFNEYTNAEITRGRFYNPNEKQKNFKGVIYG